MLASACHSSAPATQPASSASAPPASSSAAASPAQPGAGNDDPELGALERLLSQPIGKRTDKDDTLRIAFPDPKNWRRVTIIGQPTRATYRYGDDAHALETIFYTDAEGRDDLQACLSAFLSFVDETATAFDISYKRSPTYEREQTLPGGKTAPMLVVLAEGHIDNPLVSGDYVGAVAVYTSFPKTCLVQAFAVKSKKHPDEAKRARDRWVNDGAPALAWNPKKVTTDAPPRTAR